jgi:uncharacterized protein YoxC
VELAFIISQVIVLLCLAGLVVFAVVVLVKVKDVLTHLEDNVKEVSVHAIPVLENLDAITSKLRSITENINDQVTIVKESAQAIKSITDSIVSFERKVQEQIEPPVLEVAGVVAGFVRLLAGLIKRVRGGQGDSRRQEDEPSV